MIERALSSWSAHDHEACVIPADHDAVEASGAARALIIELLYSGGTERDLFTACAILGRLIAARGGSPTLAVSTVDGAAASLRVFVPDAQLVRTMRAAVAEGFHAAAREAADAAADARWEYPRCVVILESGSVAIAAGYRDDDGEALAAWASRVASGAARDGARRAIVAGGEAAMRALTDALTLVGIQVRVSTPPVVKRR